MLPPTEMNTGRPWVSGACRRTARAFARADRANHQLMGPGTRTCALGPEKVGGFAPPCPHHQKTQMIPYRYPMVAMWELSPARPGLRGATRNSLLISMTFATVHRGYCCAGKASDRENAARWSSRCLGLARVHRTKGDSVLQVVVGRLGKRVFNHSTLLWIFYGHCCG